MTFENINDTSYYTDDIEDDCYIESGEVAGRWYGFISREFRLFNVEINHNIYDRICQGYSPKGKKLVRNSGQLNRKIGWDCTFSAPKSFSLLTFCADENLRKSLLDAHESSVKCAIDFIERHAAYTRRGAAGHKLEKVGGVLAACFLHSSSRELDPQVHTHVLIFNMAPRHDRTWGSLDPMPILYWQKVCGAIYRVELAYRLSQLGFKIEKDENSFHIAGVDQNVCEEFSKRSIKIRSWLDEKGIQSSASSDGSFIKSIKPSKSKSHLQFLMRDWKKALFENGMDESFVEKISSGNRILKEVFINIDVALLDITKEKSVFTVQDIFEKLAVTGIGLGHTANSIERVFKRSMEHPSLVELCQRSNYVKLYSTEDVLQQENLMVAYAKRLSEKKVYSFSNAEISNAIDTATINIGSNFQFDDEQLEAIHSILSCSSIAILQGSAGAGKTTLLLAIKHAYEIKGLRLKGTCIARKASENLASETGISSKTLTSLLSAINSKKKALSDVDVLIIDEAGQVSCPDLLRIFKAAYDSDCNVILVGEDKQLDSIERGGALRYLSLPEVVGANRVEIIKRQKTKWARDIVECLRDGKIESGLSDLIKYKCLHWNKDKQSSIQMLLNDYFKCLKSGPASQNLVLAHNWNDVQMLSESIRERLSRAGMIGREDYLIACSVAGKRFDYMFSTGDRVRFTKNEYIKMNVSNGTLGTVTHIEETKNSFYFEINLDNGRTVKFKSSDYCDELGVNLVLAYASTIYSAQGLTVNGNTYTLFSKGMDRANTYVALSRHKNESHIYVSESVLKNSAYDGEKNIETLTRLVSRNHYASLAIEYYSHSKSVSQN